MKLVRLQKDEWFSTGSLRGSIDAIGRVYKDEGYAYVNITPNTRIDDKSRTVDVNFNIQKGNKVRIGRIEVIGTSDSRQGHSTRSSIV